MTSSFLFFHSECKCQSQSHSPCRYYLCVCVCLRASSSTLKKVVIRERKRFCAGGGGGSLVHWVNWWCKGKVCLWLAVAALSCDICVCRWSDWSDFPAATTTVVLLYRCQLLLLLQRSRSTSFSSSTNCLSVCVFHTLSFVAAVAAALDLVLHCLIR